MKKKSRFLTGLLSAVMALSLFALPAAAAGEPGSAGELFLMIYFSSFESQTHIFPIT